MVSSERVTIMPCFENCTLPEVSFISRKRAPEITSRVSLKLSEKSVLTWLGSLGCCTSEGSRTASGEGLGLIIGVGDGAISVADSCSPDGEGWSVGEGEGTVVGIGDGVNSRG